MPSGSVAEMGDGIELPAAPTSPATARQWATDRLEAWGEAELVDTVTLLVTELVTNVLLHARTPCELRIVKGDRLRVEVADGSGRIPEQRRIDGEITGSGNGLLLLSALSDDHGVVIDPTGKRSGSRSSGHTHRTPRPSATRATGTATETSRRAPHPMPPELRPVRLTGVPLATIRDADIYISDVLRELQLIKLGLAQGIVVPNRLRQLALDLLPMLTWARGPRRACHHRGRGSAPRRPHVRPAGPARQTRSSGSSVWSPSCSSSPARAPSSSEPGDDVLGLLEWFASECIGQLAGEAAPAPRRHRLTDALASRPWLTRSSRSTCCSSRAATPRRAGRWSTA